MIFTYDTDNGNSLTNTEGIEYKLNTSITSFLYSVAMIMKANLLLVKVSRTKIKIANKIVFTKKLDDSNNLVASIPGYTSLYLCTKDTARALNTSIINKITLYVKFKKLR